MSRCGAPETAFVLPIRVDDRIDEVLKMLWALTSPKK